MVFKYLTHQNFVCNNILFFLLVSIEDHLGLSLGLGLGLGSGLD